MNREQIHAQITAAAIRFTDGIVEYFGEALQGVVKDVTLGISEAAPKPPAKAVGRPKGVARTETPATAAKPAATAAKPAAKAAKPAATAAKPAAKAVKPNAKPAKQAASAKPAPKPAPSATNGRRTVSELDAAADRVQKLLSSRTGGMRIEEINKQLGTSTKELMRPIKKLLASNAIRKSGERRSTTYFAT
jgi:hypothetical protein